jgi:hypothetical protein
MLHTQHTKFNDQFHRNQYRLQSCPWHGGQHLRHDPITSRIAHQPLPELFERHRQVRKRGTIAPASQPFHSVKIGHTQKFPKCFNFFNLAVALRIN